MSEMEKRMTSKTRMRLPYAAPIHIRKGIEMNESGKGEDRPLLGVCCVRAGTSVYGGDAFLLAGSLLGVVSREADVDLATGRERKGGRTDVHG